MLSYVLQKMMMGSGGDGGKKAVKSKSKQEEKAQVYHATFFSILLLCDSIQMP